MTLINGVAPTAETVANLKVHDLVEFCPPYELIAVEWDDNNPCKHCGYVSLKGVQTASVCCGNGKGVSVAFPQLRPMPTEFKTKLLSDVEHTTKASCYYNNVFSLAATAIENGKTGEGWERINGPHAVKLHGRTYHYVPNHLNKSGGLSFFMFDGLLHLNNYTSALNEKTTFQTIREEWVHLFHDILKRVNIICRDVEFISLNFGNSDADLNRLKCVLSTKTSALDVAAVTNVSGDGNRILRIRVRGERAGKQIDMTNVFMEPLSYPMLFIYGEKGWGRETKDFIDFSNYLKFRMLMPDRNEDGTIMMMPNKTNDKLLPTNRFQLMCRVGQTYLVDMVSRAIDYRLQWVRHNTNTIFGGQPRAIQAGDHEDNNNAEEGSGATFLSQNFHGSVRHLKSKAKNALILVSEIGQPTLFITMTFNPTWPEVQSRLLPGQTAYDRPDIVDQVFHGRLENFLANIRAGRYFDTRDKYGKTITRRKILYELRSIEYQHRGFPHAHIVVKLDNIPTEPTELVKWIDEFVSARCPAITDSSPHQDIKYAELVKNHMTHKCSNAVNGCIKKDGTCKSRFDSNTIGETNITPGGYTRYRRDKLRDLFICPHNRTILEDMQGHVFVEICGAESMVYLYKYLYKGAKKDKFKLTNADDVNDKDEITLYLRARYLCSMDAMWRVLGYHTYPSPKPPIIIIKAILPAVMDFFLEKSKTTDLLLYLKRPEILHYLKYTEFYATFMVNGTMSDNIRLTRENYTVDIAGIGRRYYYRREPGTTVLVRMETLYPSVGELFFLRLILLNEPIISFAHARQCGLEYEETFQTAAVNKGYITDFKEACWCFRESAISSSPSELRTMFALMTVQGFPTLRILGVEENFKALTDDYRFRTDIINSDLARKNRLLKDLSKLLSQHSKTLSDYGFPEPEDIESELDEHRLKYPPVEQFKLFQTLSNSHPNNADQEHLFRDIEQQILDGASVKYFIQGKGGAGKSTLAKKIAAYARSKSKVVIGCASTGLAATVYEGDTL